MGSSPAGIRFKTFPLGGIHPSDNKFAATQAIRPLAVPGVVVLPLGQHVGAPSKPLVKQGDPVKVGQLIAEAAGFISAHLHSPVSGVVQKIDDVIDIAGYKRQAIYIAVNGDEWMPGIDRTDAVKSSITVSGPAIVEKIKAAGIVGLGGATFPTHVKLMVPPGKKNPEYLLVNGAECEPYLTSDHRLMLERPEEIMIGIALLMKATNIAKALIGIEANKMDAIAKLTAAAQKYAGVRVQALKLRYPQGGERQLVKALVGREIPPPPKGLPIDVGCVVVNVATAFAVYEAVQKNKPLIERVVTVTGAIAKTPGNFLVRFGTPVRFLLEQTGGLTEVMGKITAGGPMMGRAFADLDTPVTKGMGGLVVYSKKAARRGKVTNCIRCGKCVAVCPLGLEPYLIAALAEKGNVERSEEERITSCCECGCCSFICPANRPLTDFIKVGKLRVMEHQRAKVKS